MDSGLDSIIYEFVDTVGRLGAGLGLSKVASQLYGLLFINNTPLSLDDMAKRIGVSKGNVSINIRALEQWGAVRRVGVKGESRKDYYVAELDTFRIISEKLRIGLNRRIDDTTKTIKNVENLLQNKIKELDGEDKENLKGYLEQFKRIKAMSAKAKRLLNTASKISKIIGK